MIKPALSIGAQKEEALHAHVRQQLETATTPEEIRQAALIWLDELLSSEAE